MRIVNITGGLGNQMFQYAFAELLRKHFPDEDVLVDLQHFNWLFTNRFKTANLHNGYEINSLFTNATIEKATPRQLMRLSYYIPNFVLSRVARKFLPQRKTEYIQKKEDYFSYDSKVLRIPSDCYYEGYWQSIEYYRPIRDRLRFVFRHGKPNDYNQSLIDKMEQENSVGVHVRRGDYLKTASFSGICDIEYYKAAINSFLCAEDAAVFYIFSNDIEWCRENLCPLVKNVEIVFVTGNTGLNSCWDMFLMTHCKNLIIANSSFSWWAAFLNEKDGRVIAPKRWINRLQEVNLYDSSWVLL